MIGAWLGLQAVVASLVVGAWALRVLVPTRAVGAQRALLLALPLAALGPALPAEAPVAPAAQVWAPAAGEGTRARVSVGAAAPVELPVELPLEALVVALGAVPALRAGRGVARLWRGSRVLRRVGRVEVRLAPAATTPGAVWLGRPVVLLDPDTALDPGLARLAVRHELQHHRSGDPAFAWVLLGLGVVSPVALLLRRPFAEAEELACDRALLARGTPPRAYARALALIALRASPAPALVAGLSPFLPQRLAMIQHPPSSSPLRPRLAAAATLLVLALSAPVGWAAEGLLADHRVAPEEFARHAAVLAGRGAFVGAEHPLVAEALDRLVATPGGRRWAARSLANAEAVRPRFEARLAEGGLPVELAAVPFVESGYQNRTPDSLAPSVPEHQRGAGYWMFIATTARAYGLRVDATVDERLDVERETGAAIALLADGFARYGDWGLSLAAYNQGERAVDAAIAAGGTRDALALAEAGLLNDYVAQVYAAALVLADPSLVE